MFRRRYRRKHFFPFWIFFIFFFIFMGKSGFWGLMVPFILIWMFGPMLWGLTSGPRRWEEDRDWKSPQNPIPAEWQTPSPSHPSPSSPPPPATAVDPRSATNLPTACAACGGPINATTVEWRTNAPHCGYCGTPLK